ncbi:MAG: hypothetical protein KBA26_08520 [Candidatus Delongbacteria bacterium]|nr:hypothetical protein [Candidatus Delongbacteria bacterium]
MKLKRVGLLLLVLSLPLIFITCSKDENSEQNDHGRILFSSTAKNSNQPQIYRMNDDGSDQVRITNGHGYFQSAQWSWDKNLIAIFSAGGSSDQLAKDLRMIYLADNNGIFQDSIAGAGFYDDGRFVWIGHSMQICYPYTLAGLLVGYFISDCSEKNNQLNRLPLKIQHDSSSGDMMVFDSHPHDENRLLAKYQMKEQITVNGRSVINYYWCFGEISTQGEILKVYFRLDNTYVVKAKYSPDGLKMAYMPDANTITIVTFSNPDRPVDINFEKSAGYTITSLEWAPNSIDLALSLNQGSLSGIYRYEVRDMNLKPLLVSDSATYLLGDYR